MNMSGPPAGDQPSGSPLQRFASLQWYEDTLKFIFTFAAKTSEILLAAGLVISTANFLTDGIVMGSGTGIADAWAWAQALAIDSSLGVTFASIFTSLKQRDWLKVCCYGLLTALLSIVAGTITNVDTFSHAIHVTIATATETMGLNIKLLTTLRSIAVVGFVLMSRLKGVSFKELYTQPASSVPEQRSSEETEQARIRRIVAEILSQSGTHVTPEPQQPQALPDPQEHGDRAETQARSDNDEDESDEHEPLTSLNDADEERDLRLQSAYQELVSEGKRLSGRALAGRAHIRRTTCNQWLACHHPEITEEDTT